MENKTGRYRFAIVDGLVVLQVEWRGIWGVRQRYPSTVWRNAIGQDLLDLVSVDIRGSALPVAVGG